MRKLLHSAVALCVVGGLVIAGCGDDDEKDTAGSGTTAAQEGSKVPTGTTDFGAATLRANLTSLLQEHVYLSGIAVSQAAANGLDSGEFKAAAKTLDNNSVDLSKAIGSVYGKAAGDQFLPLWQKHIGFFVDYAKGKLTKDQAVVDKAVKDLDGYRGDFGAFLESANPNLPADAVAEDLKPHIASLAKAVDAVAAGSPDVFKNLSAAASHMPNTASILAGGIAKQFPDKFPGGADSPAATLRASLTAALQEHVYLSGLAVATAKGAGLDSKEFKAAADTLDANSVGVSKAIGSVYGDAAEKQFLPLWRKHIGMFVDYAKGKFTDDQALTDKAVADLDQYRSDFGAFLASANPNLTKEAVAEDLKVHIGTLAKAVDDVAAGSPDLFDDLRAAGAHMPMTAQILADAIAKQFPDKFSTT